jgi:hypothetical protein
MSKDAAYMREYRKKNRAKFNERNKWWMREKRKKLQAKQ